MLKLLFCITSSTFIFACGPERRDYRSKIPNHSFATDNVEVKLADQNEAKNYTLKATCIQYRSATERLEVGIFVADDQYDQAITLTRQVQYTLLKNSSKEVVGYSTSVQEKISPSIVALSLGSEGAFAVNATTNTKNLDGSIFKLSDNTQQLLMSRSEDGQSRINSQTELTEGSIVCKLR